MAAWQILVAILGLAAITVITRGFFVFPEREVPIPAWLREALRYAPLAALVEGRPPLRHRDGRARVLHHPQPARDDTRGYRGAPGAPTGPRLVTRLLQHLTA
jgi:hypothetical protein